MEFVNEYKYELIALLVIVFLIWMFYPSNKYCADSDPDPNNSLIHMNERRERFEPRENPGATVINDFAIRYADNMANDTFDKVIDPCSRISNQTDIIVCISNYNGYFVDILKKYIIDMYTNLKLLNGEYVDELLDLRTNEQQHFAKLIGDAYGSALSLSLDEI